MPDPAISPPPDLAPLLAELDLLTEQAAALRLRILRLSSPAPVLRPGWPIRRLADQKQNAATRPGSGALRFVGGQPC